MSQQNSPTSNTHKGIYLLPNLLTTAGLFSGFYAIVGSLKGQFEAAAVAIFVAMIFDGLDGRVARITNTQSKFGAEYDSMADIVSFGVAPALVAYSWGLSSLGKLGWLAAFLFVACAALRLARFNTQVGSSDKRYFQGLASPAAAAVVAALVWTGVEFDINGHDFNIAIAVLCCLTALLMVSNFRYSSFKDIEWKGRVPFVVILVVVFVFVFVAARPAEVLLTVFMIYALSGPVTTIRTEKKIRLEHLLGDDKDADFKDDDKDN